MRLPLANNILPLLLSVQIPKQLDRIRSLPTRVSNLSTGRDVALSLINRAASLWECQPPPAPIGPSFPPSFNNSASFYLNDRLFTITDTSLTHVNSSGTRQISAKVSQGLLMTISIPAPTPPQTLASPSPAIPHPVHSFHGLVPQSLMISISSPALVPPSTQASCPPAPPQATHATCPPPAPLSPPTPIMVTAYPPTLLIAVLSLLCGVFGTLCALMFSRSCRNALLRAFDEAHFEDKRCKTKNSKYLVQEEEELSYDWTELVKPSTSDYDVKQHDIDMHRHSSVPLFNAERTGISPSVRECSSSPLSANGNRSPHEEITAASPVSDYSCMVILNRPVCSEPVPFSSSLARRNYLLVMTAEDGEVIQDTQGSLDGLAGSSVAVGEPPALSGSPALGNRFSGTCESSPKPSGSCGPVEDSSARSCCFIEDSSATLSNNSAAALALGMSVEYQEVAASWMPKVVSASIEASASSNRTSFATADCEPSGVTVAPWMTLEDEVVIRSSQPEVDRDCQDSHEELCGTPVSPVEGSGLYMSPALDESSSAPISCSLVKDSPASEGDHCNRSVASGTIQEDSISSSEEQEATSESSVQVSTSSKSSYVDNSIFSNLTHDPIFDIPSCDSIFNGSYDSILDDSSAKSTPSCVTAKVFGCPGESQAPCDLAVPLLYPMPLVPAFRVSMKTPRSPTPVSRKTSSLRRRALHNRLVSHPVPPATPSIVSQESSYAEILETVKKTSERCEVLKKEANEFFEQIDARKSMRTRKVESKGNQLTLQVDACAPRSHRVPRFTLEHCAPVLPSSSTGLQDPLPDDFSVDVFRSDKSRQPSSPVLDPEIREKKIAEVAERIDAIKRKQQEEQERWHAELLEMSARSMRRAEEDRRKEERKQRRKEMEREEGMETKQRPSLSVISSIKDLPENSTDDLLATRFDPARSSSPKSRSIRRRSMVLNNSGV